MPSRILAAFLCLTLLLGTVPAAYAQEAGEGPEAVEAGAAKEPGEASEEDPAEDVEAAGQPEEAPEAGEGSGGTGLSEELPEEAGAEMEEEPAPEPEDGPAQLEEEPASERPEPRAASLSAEAEIPSYEQYLADYYLKYFPYDFYKNRFEMPYRAAVEHKEHDPVWQGMVASWRVATFQLSDLTDISMREAGFYEALLFDLLYEGVMDESLSGEMEQILKASQASLGKKVTNLVEEVDLSTPVADLNEESYRSLTDTLRTCDELKDVFGAIGDISQFIGMVSDVEDLIYKCCKLQVIRRMSSEMTTLLRDIRSYTSDPAMREAIDVMTELCSSALNGDAVTALFSTRESVLAGSREIMDTAWKLLLDQLNIYGIAVQAGQAVGKASANWLFSTDKTMELDNSMRVLYHFEDALKTVLDKYESDYQRYGGYDTALSFNCGVEMLMRAHQLSMRYARQYTDLLYKDGAVNTLLFWLKADRYNQYISDLESIERSMDEAFRFAQTSTYNMYVEAYAAGAEKEPVVIVPIVAEKAWEELEAASARCSNVYIRKDARLTEDLETAGSLYIDNGAILDLNGHTLTVGGDALQMWGDVRLNGGALVIWGDYRLQDIEAENGGFRYGSAYGSLNMDVPEDRVYVGGDMYVETSNSYANSSRLYDGRLELAGDFTLAGGYFNSVSGHTFAVLGPGPHRIENPGYIDHLEIAPEAGAVTWAGRLMEATLESDCVLLPEGLELSGGRSPLAVDLNGHNMTIKGDVKIGGNVICRDSALTVEGNVLHDSGTISLERGTLRVKGNYRAQCETPEGVYVESVGILQMWDPMALMQVDGDMYVEYFNNVQEWHLKAGTLKVAGDFTLAGGVFEPGIGHTTVLNGTHGVQRVSFTAANGGFYGLALTRDPSFYEFDPEPCWMELREAPPEILGWDSEGSVNPARLQGRRGGAGTLLCQLRGPVSWEGASMPWELRPEPVQARVLALFYDEEGRLLDCWSQSCQRSNGKTVELRGRIPDYDTIKVLLVEREGWTPVCAGSPASA